MFTASGSSACELRSGGGITGEPGRMRRYFVVGSFFSASLNLKGIVTHTATGFPLISDGVNRYSFAATSTNLLRTTYA